MGRAEKLKAIKQARWKGTFRVAPLVQSYHEESLGRAVALLGREPSKKEAARAYLSAVLQEPATLGSDKLEKIAKRSGLGTSTNRDAWKARMESTRKKLAAQNVIVSPTLYLSEGRYTGEGGFGVKALQTLFEGKTEVKK